MTSSQPCGEDLDESGEIFRLDQAFGWAKTELPQWRELRENVEGGLVRSRDLRLAVAIAVVVLNTEGPAPFGAALTFLRSLLERFWETVHPRVEEDGNADSRRNALLNLCSFYRVLRPLQRSVLVEHRAVGRFSALDVDIAEGRVEAPADYTGDLPQLASIEAAFAAVGAETIAAKADVFSTMLRDLEAISSMFNERVPNTGAPDLERLLETLRRSEAILRSRLPASPAIDGSQADGNQESALVGLAGNGSAVAASRRDALLAIERAVRYFRDCEPTSPVPILLERAIKLADSDFLSIVRDIAPDAVVMVNLLSGRRDQDE